MLSVTIQLLTVISSEVLYVSVIFISISRTVSSFSLHIIFNVVIITSYAVQDLLLLLLLQEYICCVVKLIVEKRL